MTYGELYRQGKEMLAGAGIGEAELDARLLLEFVCKTTRNDLLVHGDRTMEPEKEADYREKICRRMSRIPLQHLTGVQEFMGLEFAVDENVLIPRQDTEILVEEVLRNLHDGMRVLDMCTGSGCILISLLHYSNHCLGVGADISEKALACAEKNAVRLLGGKYPGTLSGEACPGEGKCPGENRETDNPGEPEEGFGGFRLIHSDLFEHITGKFDIIVSNPPYIRSGEIADLMPEVREHEPAAALDGGEDGLDYYRRIVQESRAHLYGGGKLFLEIGYDQADAVRDLLEKAGYLEIEVVKDYAGLCRVVHGARNFE